MNQIVLLILSIHLLINLVNTYESINPYTDNRLRRGKYKLEPEYSGIIELKSRLESPYYTSNQPNNPFLNIQNNHLEDNAIEDYPTNYDHIESSFLNALKAIGYVSPKFIDFYNLKTIYPDQLKPSNNYNRRKNYYEPAFNNFELYNRYDNRYEKNSEYQNDDDNSIDYIQDEKSPFYLDEDQTSFQDLDEMDNAYWIFRNQMIKLILNLISKQPKAAIRGRSDEVLEISDPDEIRERVTQYMDTCQNTIKEGCSKIRNVINLAYDDTNDLSIMYQKYCMHYINQFEYEDESMKNLYQTHYREIQYNREHLEEIFEIRKLILPQIINCHRWLIKYCETIRFYLQKNGQELDFITENTDILIFYRNRCKVFDELSEIMKSINPTNNVYEE